MSYAVRPSALTWRGERAWDRIRVTCGAVATPAVASLTAASHSRVPALSVSEL